ncbi:MAG: pantoate--beta-alanine ligase [Desulfocapsaceae bacterium]|nr:pantoate--beta-alanine ligase [Desulfocapsaceae bacterium]
MKLVKTINELRNVIANWRSEGKTVGLVPTMGWFHLGHLSLMKMAKGKADKVVVSLFINPMQFGQGEDLAAYPYDLSRDMHLAEKEGVDLLFAPSSEEMYPEGFQTSITVKNLSQGLCGASRPVHFAGVATVVAKLFNMVQPDLAIFGKKDFQQLAVIRQMVKDLNFNIEILGHPLVREDDGLAMSSRNSYLNQEERRNARCLYRAITSVREKVSGEGTEPSVAQLTDEVTRMINATSGCAVEYVEVVDKETLQKSATINRNSIIVLAVKINGRVRLIDNALLYPEENDS